MIARTFKSVFPKAILWIDPASRTGIWISPKNDDGDLGMVWPGLPRANITRSLSDDEIPKAALLDRTEILRYGQYGDIIDDDKQ